MPKLRLFQSLLNVSFRYSLNAVDQKRNFSREKVDDYDVVVILVSPISEPYFMLFGVIFDNMEVRQNIWLQFTCQCSIVNFYPCDPFRWMYHLHKNLTFVFIDLFALVGEQNARFVVEKCRYFAFLVFNLHLKIWNCSLLNIVVPENLHFPKFILKFTIEESLGLKWLKIEKIRFGSLLVPIVQEVEMWFVGLHVIDKNLAFVIDGV